MLEALWNAVGKAAEAEGQRGGIAPEGLKAYAVTVAGRVAALVTLPPVQGVTEAHFVALVLDESAAGSAEPGPVRPAPRLWYFTLENGLSPDLQGRSEKLCEWTANGMHLNYGPGPKADGAAFLRGRREGE